jgi:hypothetical protein
LEKIEPRRASAWAVLGERGRRKKRKMEKEERRRRKKSKIESFDVWERWQRGRDKGKYFGAWRERAMMVACNFFVRGRDKNTIFYV